MPVTEQEALDVLSELVEQDQLREAKYMHGARLNQSRSHQDLADRALVWIGARASFSGCLGTTEFKVANGYSADAFALCCQQYEYWAAISGKHPDAGERGLLLFPQQIASHIFEVKVSRADFLSTFKDPNGKHANRHKPVANLHYLVTEPGVCDPKEVPGFWGILHAKGRGLSVIRQPKFIEIQDSQNDEYGHRMLWIQRSQARMRHLHIHQCPNCCGEQVEEMVSK